MENWEFLLQKEGDRAWLPLESADVEILEGRYRVVARSTLHNTNIEVRVTHQLTQEVPPQWRVQKRSTRTNQEGLMVVIPYTSLKPGIWELSCVANLTTESEKSREHKVQLQVLPLAADDGDDIDEPLLSNTEESTEVSPTETTTNILESATPAIATSTASVLSQVNPSPEVEAQQPENPYTEEILVAAKAKLEKLRSFSSENLAVLTKNSVLDISSLSQFNLRLSLEKQNFVAQLGQPLIIYGQVDISEKTPTDNDDLEAVDAATKRLQRAIAKAEVQICLRDPQTSQILIDMRQPLPPQVPPCFFAFTIYLPSDCQTRLILGEAVLWDGKESLCTECLTITARLEQLLSVITDNFSEEEHKANTSEAIAKQEEVALNQSFTNLSETLKEPTPAEFPLSPPGQLPPQIATRSPVANPHQSLDLPAFGRAIPKNDSNILPAEIAKAKDLVASANNQPKEENSKVVNIFSGKLKQPELLQVEVTEELNLREKNENSPRETSPSFELSKAVKSDVGLIIPEVQLTMNQTESETVETGFLGLKEQDRFLNRLSALANDSELSAWLKASMPPTAETTDMSGKEGAAVEEKAGVKGEEIGLNSDPETNLDIPGKTDWKSREFVVFDDPLPARKAKKVILSAEKESEQPQLSMQRMPYILPEDESVPIPILDVITKDILAGRLVKLRVRLPELLPRIYVKIWVYDRQSFVILDGPRWITEFSANGLGQIEAIGELEIAFGSLDVEFEAIAVEMQTLRESNKVTVHRQVVPPPGPILPLDK
jgi:hypothetical protein